MTEARQPTLDTVAAAAGVSRATVSRVVNGTARVSPRVHARVENAIAELGYVPNRVARNLVNRRTDSVALVLREPDATVLADPYLGSMIIAISRALADTSFQLVLVNARNDSKHGSLADYVRGGHFDGVLLASMHTDDPLPGVLVGSNMPTVVSGRPEHPIPGLFFVDSDNVGGGRLATEYLLSRGRRRIATIAGPPDMTASHDRLDGYRAALADTAVSEGLVAPGDFTDSSGERAMAELLDRAPGLDAVFAGNDMMAAGALRALRARGRRVPDDVAVVGYDDIDLAHHTEPALTTVRQPVDAAARTMVDLLIRQIDGDRGGESVVLPNELVKRDSA